MHHHIIFKDETYSIYLLAGMTILIYISISFLWKIGITIYLVDDRCTTLMWNLDRYVNTTILWDVDGYVNTTILWDVDGYATDA
jgi:hypothetical protein